MDENKPLLIFDGDCAFCRLWIAYWQQITGDSVKYEPFQKVETYYPRISHEAFEKSVHLIQSDGRVFKSAHAVFRTLAQPPRSGWLLWMYEHMPWFAAIAEWAYALVAAHRDLFYHLTVFFIGKPAVASYRLTRWLFIRAIGLSYLFAFASLIPQIRGLVGQNGILPVSTILDDVYRLAGARGYWLFPTLFWVNSSDAMLTAVTVIGAIIAALVVVGVGQRLGLIVMYVLYLSLLYAGQDFLSFQWDILLLEAGFLAIFLAPGYWIPRLPASGQEPPRGFIWLVRWLLFRLMFGSGMVKLMSGDPTWRSLAALDYHFYTQPLPTPLGWAAAQLPSWMHVVMTAATFGIELVIPFFIFLPRRVRFLGGFALIAFQLLIALTGNYAFFNLLAIALCIPLFDDAALSRIVPARWRIRLVGSWARLDRPAWKRSALALAGLILALGSAGLFADQLSQGAAVPASLYPVEQAFSRYGIANTYGLFAVMTTSREEIIIEGSNDGVTWLAYEFPFKPGDVRRAPLWVAPYQPRLDWQMWFAALGTYEQSPWFANLMFRLLQGSPDVLSLFSYNPFPSGPPRFIRARLVDYHFSGPATLSRGGAWWVATNSEIYFPPVSLDQFQ